MRVPSDGPAVIIGNPNSLFPRQLAGYWRTQGLDVIIVTRRHWSGGPCLEDGTQVLAAETRENAELADHLDVVYKLLTEVEESVLGLDPDRAPRVMRDWGVDGYAPSFVPPVIDGLGISRIVRELRPRFVFGQEAFAYGLATALCEGFPRILMPWGGDVFLFAETSPLAFAAVKYALHRVDRVVTTSASAVRHMQRRFGLPGPRIEVVSWGVDHRMFRRAEPDERESILKGLGVDPWATVCTNIRRFSPAWGSREALEAFLRLAREEPSCHFVVLCGAGSEGFQSEARGRIEAEGLGSRFTTIRGDAPLEEFARVLSVTDVAVSLMRVRDMRSFSILQAAASGCALVASEQPEYREMERLGLDAAFVDPGDVEAVVRAIRSLVHDPVRREEASRRNGEYVRQHEDWDTQMRAMLEMIGRVADSVAGQESGPGVPVDLFGSLVSA